jgi:Flp pilus assembly pilin Flp
LKRAARRPLLERLHADEAGITSVEYGLLSCIAALVLLAFTASGMSPTDFVKRVGALSEVLAGEDSAEVQNPLGYTR